MTPAPATPFLVALLALLSTAACKPGDLAKTDAGTDTDSQVAGDTADDVGGDTDESGGEPETPVPIFLVDLTFITDVTKVIIGMKAPTDGATSDWAQPVEAAANPLVANVASLIVNQSLNITLQGIEAWSSALVGGTEEVFGKGGKGGAGSRFGDRKPTGTADGRWYSFAEPIVAGETVVTHLKIIVQEPKDAGEPAAYVFEFWCDDGEAELFRCVRIRPGPGSGDGEAGEDASSAEFEILVDAGTDHALLVRGSFDEATGVMSGEQSLLSFTEGAPRRAAFHYASPEKSVRLLHVTQVWDQLLSTPILKLPRPRFFPTELKVGDVSVNRVATDLSTQHFARLGAFLPLEAQPDVPSPLTEAVFAPYAYSVYNERTLLEATRSKTWHPDCGTFGGTLRDAFPAPVPAALADFPDDVCDTNTGLTDQLLLDAVAHACTSDATIEVVLSTTLPGPLHRPIDFALCPIVEKAIPEMANPQVFGTTDEGPVQFVPPTPVPKAAEAAVAGLAAAGPLPIQLPASVERFVDDLPRIPLSDVRDAVELP